MEISEYTDLYCILHAVLDEVCRRILSKSKDDQEESDRELTVDNILDICEEELEAELMDDGEYYDGDVEEEIEMKEADQVEELYHFLTQPDEKYDVAFKTVADEMEYPFIQDYILYKHILILLIVSTTYFGLVYDEEKGFVKEDNELLELYKTIISDIDSIYRLFRDDEEHAKQIIDYFLDYFYDCNYIRKTLTFDSIEKKGKLKKLLKMNPLEVFSYMLTYGSEEITEAERTIQNFSDAYSYILMRSYEEEMDEEERKDLFLQKIEEYYQHDEIAIDKAIAYIFGNVYEHLKLHYTYDENAHNFAEVIEDNVDTLDQFIRTFKTDVDLFWTMMDYFYNYNCDLDPDSLALVRFAFKKEKQNVKVLKRLNPFYEQEEELFKGMEVKE